MPIASPQKPRWVRPSPIGSTVNLEAKRVTTQPKCSPWVIRAREVSGTLALVFNNCEGTRARPL
eukprot:3688007-Pyramimonas_sp.AAC.1